MKKLFLLPVALLLATFLFISPVFATSGCCSSHGGVNCAAGAQGNGHVICNDGWTGSSCLYSSMVMCGGSSGGSTYQAPTPTVTLIPVYVPPVEIKATATSTPKPTATSTPQPTSTPIPTNSPTATPTLTLTASIEATPTATQTLTPTPSETPKPSVKAATTEFPRWKFHWWNVSPLMGFFGWVLNWE